MTTERDTARIVRSWLRTDEHESAGRVLDNVLAALDATPQRRRPLLPAWRIAPVNTYAKLAIAAAAVVVVAVVGYTFLPGIGPGPGGASPSPSPHCGPTPASSGSPEIAFPPSGALGAGTCQSMVLEGVPFAFRVPSAGWTSNGIYGIDRGLIGPEGAGFIFWVDAPVAVFSDPCAQVKGPDLGASPAALAEAVAAVPGTTLVSGPSDVRVGRYPAKQVVINIPEDADCPATSFHLWYAPSPDQARYVTELGSTIRVWIVDVDGSIVWIDGETYKGATLEPGRQIQQIVDSISFE